MTLEQLSQALMRANRVAEVEAALEEFEHDLAGRVDWVPFGGKPNNRGVIEVAANAGRALVERLTNGVDAVLEWEHQAHHGLPVCRTPREAAAAWLNVPGGGLSEMTPAQRRALAQKTTIRLLEGDARELRCLEVRDRGTGIAPADMASTILSLNESNKIQKLYLSGTYGQGGSSTFAFSRCTLIASRKTGSAQLGFTIVRYLELPPEEFKTGRYVYLTVDGTVPAIVAPDDFESGTLVKHYGYDISAYSSPVGPGSLYGLLNQVLFDPVLPVWLDSRVHDYRRVIKGSRNALNGAVDEGDERRDLAHQCPIFFVDLGGFGRIGIEYWVLPRPTRENQRPIAAFVNPTKPIVLTQNGQNHAEMPSTLIRKHAELPFLTQRLIVHVDCNSLSPAAKRALFVSNREDARRVAVYERIEQEIVTALRSDDNLTRLNNEARQAGIREQDEATIQQMRREVSRLLRLHGFETLEPVGGRRSAEDRTGVDRPARPRIPRTPPQPIPPQEPPTFIRIVWDPVEPITFYEAQRRYVRIETDANTQYYDPDPRRSRINIIATTPGVSVVATTSLRGGRLRVVLDAAGSARVGDSGVVRVELTRPGLTTLSDERLCNIVDTPPARADERRVAIPDFDWREVEGPEHELWLSLGWPENVNDVASEARQEEGKLVIYWSTVFPKYEAQLNAFQTRDPALAESFTARYKVWLAVHSALLHQEQRNVMEPPDADAAEAAMERERKERCRVAVIATLAATREVQLQGSTPETE